MLWAVPVACDLNHGHSLAIPSFTHNTMEYSSTNIAIPVAVAYRYCNTGTRNTILKYVRVLVCTYNLYTCVYFALVTSIPVMVRYDVIQNHGKIKLQRKLRMANLAMLESTLARPWPLFTTRLHGPVDYSVLAIHRLCPYAEVQTDTLWRNYKTISNCSNDKTMQRRTRSHKV